jgi:hypothetical protein
MPEFRFDPPLTLKGNIVVRNLDDAVRFMIGYREAHGPALQTSVLHRVEGAAGEAEERHAGYAFRVWAEAEGLIINSANKKRPVRAIIFLNSETGSSAVSQEFHASADDVQLDRPGTSRVARHGARRNM